MSPEPRSQRDRRGNGFARWQSSWRYALKIGLRDCLRHRGRSLLVMILIGVPVLIVTAGLTVYGTWEYRTDDWAKAGLGASQAIVTPPVAPAEAVSQDPYGQYLGSRGTARLRPGSDSEQPWRSGDIAALTGDSQVAALADGQLVSFSGPSPVGIRTLTVDSPSIGDFGLAELIEGRWPAKRGEVVVTDRAIQPGVPRTGPMTITVDGIEQDSTVVGVVRAPTTAIWEVIISGPVADQGSRFLVQRSEPVTWTDVLRLNEYGLTVQSRTVMDQAPPYVAAWSGHALGPEQRTARAIQIAAMSVGILIEVALLAGPAFALGAARQRRIWALIAACGADRRQLRRIVLGQSVILGGAAAVIGTAIGLAVSPAATHLLWWSGVTMYYGSWRPPLSLIAAVMAAAVVAAVIAALGPARAASRRDVASTLNERWQPPPPRRGIPLVGVGLVVLAAVGMIVAATWGHGQLWAWPVVIAGCIVLTVGCLMIIPVIVAGWGRVGHRWPLSIRLAARDLGRQHQRSIPAIAAVAAATAVLAAIGVLFASQTALAVKVHTPVTTPGQGVLSTYGNGTELRYSLDRLKEEFPDWSYLERDRLDARLIDDQGAYTAMLPVPAGCQEADVIRAMSDRQPDQDGCLPWGDPYSAPLVQDIPKSDRALAPESAQALRAGQVLITDPALVVDGRVRLIMITRTLEGSDPGVVTRRVELPAVVVDPVSLIGTLHHTSKMLSEPYGWMLPRTADAHGLSRELDRVLFGPVGRDITPAEEVRIQQLIHPDLRLLVERGHVDDHQPTFLLFLAGAGFLVLLAAVVATALAQVDGRSEQETLAAVGAAPAVRRGQAAGQALLLSLTGMIFGAVVGFIPGVAVALLDQPPWTVAPGPQLALPWPELGLLIIIVPLIAAGLAALTARTPVLSRRPT